MRILGIEPYYGGSHRAVLDGLVERIDADWTLLTLPARKWKWRMRGSAITFAADLRERHAARLATGESGPGFDLLFASTFVNLAELYGLAAEALAGVPSILYFHENQFAYPNRHVADWDYQFPLTNVTSALTASTCVFNSHYTRRTFVGEIDAFMREFPDHRPRNLAEEIDAKSCVIAPPFDPAPFDAVPLVRGARPRIVWPHRWEHDKDPETFFAAVARLANEGLDFEVAVAGQSFRETAQGMHEAAMALGDRLVHVGEPESRDDYAALLASSDVAVSTATNEFFGLAMMEACYAGATPLMPDRLAYVDLYPVEYRYDGMDELVARLGALVLERPSPGAARELASRYTFDAMVGEYAALFGRVWADSD
ncbi:MAG: DUF3524 domain-containing protein [Actinobacteria bacterium HGW-Actinobacteria-10]|nr:MAG: DUF3524 domain-containing protein [Actinobacteria bacterium HGW-Actinobacteria-10]